MPARPRPSARPAASDGYRQRRASFAARPLRDRVVEHAGAGAAMVADGRGRERPDYSTISSGPSGEPCSTRDRRVPSADEARRHEDRRRRRLRLPDGADRRPRRCGHRLGRRFGRRQHVGAARASSRSRSTRCCSRARRCGAASSARSSAATCRTARCRKARVAAVQAADAAGERGRRRHAEAGRGGRISRRGARHRRRRHPGVGAVRHHAAHGHAVQAECRRPCRSWPRS